MYDSFKNDGNSKGDEINKKVKKINLEANPDIEKLINILTNNNNENILVPDIDYNKNLITYPILRQIGHDENDVGFLDKLALPEINVLKKSEYESVLVCPEHPQYFTLSPKLCCASCASTDISRLHLFEHKVCGYLAESSEFKVKSIEDVSSCPSCEKNISYPKQEMRIAGNWCKCNNCKTKFDDCKVRLHCREFDHDFDIGQAEICSIPSYKIVNETEQVLQDKFSAISEIKELLASNGFFTEHLTNIKGNSGIEHPVSLYGSNSAGQSIAVFVEMAETEINDSKVNEILMTVIDISTTFTIFVGTPSISASAKELFSANNILVVTGTNVGQILRMFKDHLSQLTIIKTKPEEI